MLYAILAYHVEEEVASLTPQEDAALMLDLSKVHERFLAEKRVGPTARLGATSGACVLRGPGKGAVIDGPFTESKEQLLGFYVMDFADRVIILERGTIRFDGRTEELRRRPDVLEQTIGLSKIQLVG